MMEQGGKAQEALAFALILATIKEYLKTDFSVRRHGNGFIQAPLWDRHSLHVWDVSLPQAQKVDASIHDHRWSFQSTVLYGRLRNRRYTLSGHPYEKPGRFRIWVVDRNNEHLERTIVTTDLVYEGSEDISPGGSYGMAAGEFHESQALTPTVLTLFKKGPATDSRPRALCPNGIDPDNDYDWFYDVEGFREIVREAFNTFHSIASQVG